MSREKDNKNIQDKLKTFFRNLNKTNPANLVQTKEYELSKEILQDLGKDATYATRTRIMKDLMDNSINTRLEPNGVEKLWRCLSDLFHRETPTDVRHAAFAFFGYIIRGQFEKMGLMRAEFFRFIKQHDNPEDLAQRIDLLSALTNDGKEVEHFGEEIGEFLLKWFAVVGHIGKLQEYLKIVDNVIKFNSSYISGAIMSGFVKELCILCTDSNQSHVVNLSLQLLFTVLAYSILPAESLPQFVGTLCRTVNVKCYSEISLKTMKNLLGTHLGHSTLFTMCRFLQEPNLRKDADLMRGCVFYIYVALWDSNATRNLCCPPSSVLPSFLHAVKCNHPTVAYEVTIGVGKLINRHRSEILEPTWDIILEILLHIQKQVEISPNDKPNNLTSKDIQEIYNTIENLIDNGTYKGSIKQYYGVIHQCARERPEQSILKLIKYTSKSIRPTENNWLHNLSNLFANYFKPEIRTNIRLKVLNVLSDVLQLYRQYEDELIGRIVIPHLQNIHNDENTIIRCEVAKLLINSCLDQNSSVPMDILERLLLRPYERMGGEHKENDFSDIDALITGLIPIFAKKIHQLPSSQSIRIYKMFVSFLERNFQVAIFKNHHHSRNKILACLLKMRADSFGHLGYPDTNKEVKFSSYLCVTYKFSDSLISSPPHNSPTLKLSYIAIDCVFHLFLEYLAKEKDWEVLKLILNKLPAMLGNKAIILTKSGNNDLNKLLDILCTLLENGKLESERIVKVSHMEFQTALVSVIVALSSYSNNLDQSHQRRMILTLSNSTGTAPRCSKQSINALTICMVDMRETMMKALPTVLLRLSQISATNHIAMPILEFLSTLSQLPTVYGNFVGDQYMAVFAIALPYTNPFKYDNYIVSLAYHVISVWFLKCRLPFRKDFVKFIVSGLQTNVMVPFSEFNQFKYNNLSALNQDSSDRKRSSSLNEPSSSRRRSKTAEKKSSLTKNPPIRDQTVLTFYEELNETCIDLMARYTYSPCSALPTRLPTAEFLLNDGISKSWMLGNKLITITTSGCTEKVLKHGVCDKCWTACGSHNNSKIEQYRRSNSGGDSTEKEPAGANLTRQNSNEQPQDEKKTTDLGKLIADGRRDTPICACWCQGWAEILIRRPTGNVSWVMKVQNQVSFKQLIFEFPLNEMATLYMPDLFVEGVKTEDGLIGDKEAEIIDEMPTVSTKPISVPGSPKRPPLSRQSSHDDESEPESIYDDTTGTKSRNPVRRSNSSPEMANWKNPIMQQAPETPKPTDDGPKKDTIRVSCEAIPEEISANQKDDDTIKHPSLYSRYSYPGSSPPNAESHAKPNKTVPASPNLLLASNQPDFQKRPNNLPNLINLLPMTTHKPPQSPTQTSPRLERHHTIDLGANPIEKSQSSSKLERGHAKIGLDLGFAEKRDRLHTVSVMSTSSTRNTLMKKVPKEILKSGLNPSFIFLQLYHTAAFGHTNEVPLFVHKTGAIERAIKMLDIMYPYEVHKIGVIYVNEGQADKEADILRNTYGCVRYVEFLQNLGTLIRLGDVNPRNVYLGGIDQGGCDGKYMYTHQDDLVMLAFHVATLMPNKESDPNANSKKAHVGNDNVVIVYNNSGKEFDISTFKSQVTLAYIIVEPLDYNCNKVEVKMKSELLNIIGSNEVIIVSDQSVSILVRQLAIHADLVATVLNSLRSHSTNPYASNWLERLRKLKDLRARVEQEIKARKDATKGFSEEKDIVEDFTDFT